MKRLFGRLIMAAVAVAVIAFFIAPAVAFYAIRSAADASDVAGLARLIDFGAVRQSLRLQMSGRPETLAPPPSFLQDPIGAVRRQLEPALPGAPDPDVYLTPSALAALTRGEGRGASERVTVETPAAARNPAPRPAFWGVNRVRLAVSGDGGKATVFTFERKALYEWKLVHIGLPERALSAAATGQR